MRKALVVISSCLALGVAAEARATVIAANQQGAISQNGVVSGNYGTPAGNYVVGNCGVADCSQGEYRDYFGFLLSSNASAASSAFLTISTGYVALDQLPTLTVQVSSLSATPTFALLGGGTAYATQSYTASSVGGTIVIALDAAALADIRAAAGGEFLIGGRVISPTLFGPTSPDELVYSTNAPVSLTFNTSAVPEPATLTLLSAGLLGLCARRRRRPTES